MRLVFYTGDFQIGVWDDKSIAGFYIVFDKGQFYHSLWLHGDPMHTGSIGAFSLHLDFKTVCGYIHD